MAVSKFQFLEPDTIVETYFAAKQYTESLTYPWFIEYERLARNEVRPDIPKNYPKTTDGTTASVVRKTPYRIIQQVPTGTVVSDAEDWLTIVASFIYKKKIIPYANAQYDLIQKCWGVVEKGMTFGSQFTYVPFLNHDGYFCPDLTLPYWGDIMVQPGKLSDADCNYIFMRSWWDKRDLEALIARETAQQKKSKKYQSTWDVNALKDVLISVTTKDTVAQTPVEREKAVNQKGRIELVTGFQKGVGANFYTFHPSTREIVRTKPNKDPRGEMPIMAFYAGIDNANPLGRGVVELVGGLQNLMDAEMQMYQYNRALMLNPPLIKHGQFNKNRIKFEPNTIIDVGSEQTADVVPLQIDTKALENFPNNYGLMKGQLLNLLGSPNTDISATTGNANSKTPQGVMMTNSMLTVDDNYMRKQFEAWFEKWSETALNLYFAERTGIEELQLDDDTAQALRDLGDKFDQTLLNDANQIRINYDSATPALHFRVDPSSSQMKDDPNQYQIAVNLLELVMKYPQMNKKWGGTVDADELERKIVRMSAIQDPEAIAPTPTAAQRQQAAQNNQPNGFSPLFDKPKISIAWEQLSPMAQQQVLALAGVQVPMEDILNGPIANINARGNTALDKPLDSPVAEPQVTADHLLQADQQAHDQAMAEAEFHLKAHQANNPPQQTKEGKPKAPAQFQLPTPPPQGGVPPEDQPIVDALKQAGASEQQIGQAIAMLNHGVPAEKVLQMLMKGASNG